MPDPPPTGSPAPDRGSRPEMIDEVGDDRPRRLPYGLAAGACGWGYRLPATDIPEGKAFAVSLWTFARSFSRVAFRFCNLSRSALVLDSSSCKSCRRFCKS